MLSDEVNLVGLFVNKWIFMQATWYHATGKQLVFQEYKYKCRASTP